MARTTRTAPRSQDSPQAATQETDVDVTTAVEPVEHDGPMHASEIDGLPSFPAAWVDPSAPQSTTLKRARVVAAKDAGMTLGDIARLIGIKVGGTSNLLNDGLRDLGRDSEITSSTGGGRMSQPATPLTMAQAALERAVEQRTNVSEHATAAAERITSFREAAVTHGFDLDDIAERYDSTDDDVTVDPIEQLVVRKARDLDASAIRSREGQSARIAVLDTAISKWEKACEMLASLEV